MIFHNNSGNIDFSSLKGTDSNAGTHAYTLAIAGMELANGKVLEVNDQGNFVCVNCHNYAAKQLEDAANSMLHHI